MLITTYTLQYLNPEQHDGVVNNVVTSLKTNGRMLADDCFRKSGPFLYAVSELPESLSCEKDKIYFSINSKQRKLCYCYYSNREAKVIRSQVSLDYSDLAYLVPYISPDKNPQELAPIRSEKILKLIDYAKHNIINKYDYFKEPHFNFAASGLLFFAAVLNRKSSSTTFTYNFFGEKFKSTSGEIHEAVSLKRKNYSRFSEF